MIECVRIFKLEVGNIWYRRLRCLLSYYNAWEDCGLLSRLPLYKLAIFDIIDSSFAWNVVQNTLSSRSIFCLPNQRTIYTYRVAHFVGNAYLTAHQLVAELHFDSVLKRTKVIVGRSLVRAENPPCWCATIIPRDLSDYIAYFNLIIEWYSISRIILWLIISRVRFAPFCCCVHLFLAESGCALASVMLIFVATFFLRRNKSRKKRKIFFGY